MAESDSLRLAFAGTSDFAASHLRALIDARANLVGVFTQPDRPSGRGRKLTASPVKQLALEFKQEQKNSLDIFQPEILRGTEAQPLADLSPDVLVVVAYGLILPREVLDIPALACINVHGSLLPRWRGAAPIQRAVEAGDSESGITIMQMEEGLDTGPMLSTDRVNLDPTMTAGDLHDKLATIGPPLLLKALNDLPDLLQRGQAQDESAATYARKIDKAEAEIDWRQPAVTLVRKIMAFNPFPGAWTQLDGERLKLWRAVICEDGGPAGQVLSADEDGLVIACGEGSLKVTEMQLPGRKAMPTGELLRSRHDLASPGKRLG